jgi:hypothetical protein
METISYDLQAMVPMSTATGVKITRLEIPKYGATPLVMVWYTIWDDRQERGARIDLHKQVFLDNFGDIDKSNLNAEARLVVNFMSSLATRQTLVAAMATAAMPGMQRLADPWQPKNG